MQIEEDNASLLLKPFFVKMASEIATHTRYLRKRMCSDQQLAKELAERAKQPRRELVSSPADEERGAFAMLHDVMTE